MPNEFHDDNIVIVITINESYPQSARRGVLPDPRSLRQRMLPVFAQKTASDRFPTTEDRVRNIRRRRGQYYIILYFLLYTYNRAYNKIVHAIRPYAPVGCRVYNIIYIYYNNTVVCGQTTVYVSYELLKGFLM